MKRLTASLLTVAISAFVMGIQPSAAGSFDRNAKTDKLARAIFDEKPSQVEAILKSDPQLINAVVFSDFKAGTKETPLQLAASGDRIEITKVLLRLHAPVDAGPESALHIASRQGCKNVVPILLAHGANVNLVSPDRTSPLEEALWNHNSEIADMLVAHGATISPLAACGLGRLDLVKATPLAQLKKLSAEKKRSALAIAAYNNRDSVVRYLIAGGFSANDTVDFGQTLLTDACSHSNKETIGQLIKAGADVNKASGINHWTPLFMATWANRPDIMLLLIDHGANVNSRSEGDTTPLHWAASCNLPAAAEVLIKHGANLESRRFSSHGTINAPLSLDEMKTPLHSAAERGSLEVVKLLVASHANVNAKSQFLKTPLDLALDSGKDAAGVVKYLRSIGATCRADQPEADQAALDAVLKKTASVIVRPNDWATSDWNLKKSTFKLNSPADVKQLTNILKVNEQQVSFIEFGPGVELVFLDTKGATITSMNIHAGGRVEWFNWQHDATLRDSEGAMIWFKKMVSRD